MGPIPQIKNKKVPCNCIAESKKHILEHLVKNTRNPKGYKIVESDFDNCSIFPKNRLYVNLIITSTFTKKDGATSRPRKQETPVFFTYCPFCGIKYPEN